MPPNAAPKEKTIFDYSGIFTDSAKEQYTGGDVERIIDEGLIMDFREQVARPPQPRARAKFEPYEKLLLLISFGMWPLTIVMTFAYEGSLASMSDFQAGTLGLGAVWAISLFVLIVLIRFDKAARSSGMYGKEKESYSGMMDLYNKAQEAHYEYVKLRAAAEAQQILEKYPQLKESAKGKSTEA